MHRFFVASESHARLSIPLIRRLGGAVVYLVNTFRNALIKHEFAIGNVDHLITYVSADRLFFDIREIPDYFHLFLAYGPNGSHPVFDSLPGSDLCKGILMDAAGTIILMNEELYYPRANYVPFAHVLVARSEVERKALERQRLPGSEVLLIGDPWLDFLQPRYSVDSKVLGVATTLDAARVKTKSAIQEVQAHLVEWHKAGKGFDKVLIKGHPGDLDNTFTMRIANLCAKYDWPYLLLDSRSPFDGLYRNIGMGIVQSSFTVHFSLRRMGKESFFFWSDTEYNGHHEFIRRTQMPPCKLNHTLTGHYDSAVYDNWMADTFLLDGNVVDRLLGSI